MRLDQSLSSARLAPGLSLGNYIVPPDGHKKIKFARYRVETRRTIISSRNRSRMHRIRKKRPR